MNFDDDVKDFNSDKNNKISFNSREFTSLSTSQFQSLIVLINSQSQILLTNSQSQILQTNFQSQILTTQSLSDENMLDISQIFNILQIKTTKKISKKEITIDNTIQKTKRSLELSIIIFDYEKKKTSHLFFFATKQRFIMYQEDNSTSLFKKASFANNLMKTIFQDDNFYLKTIININEVVQSRWFSCDYSLTKDEIFQEKVTMYFSRKKSLKSAKWILPKRYATKDLNKVCGNCVFILKFLFEFQDTKFKIVKTKLIELMTTSS